MLYDELHSTLSDIVAPEQSNAPSELDDVNKTAAETKGVYSAHRGCNGQQTKFSQEAKQARQGSRRQRNGRHNTFLVIATIILSVFVGHVWRIGKDRVDTEVRQSARRSHPPPASKPHTHAA